MHQILLAFCASSADAFDCHGFEQFIANQKVSTQVGVVGAPTLLLVPPAIALDTYPCLVFVCLHSLAIDGAAWIVASQEQIKRSIHKLQ
jgi:hypothetical protein